MYMNIYERCILIVLAIEGNFNAVQESQDEWKGIHGDIAPVHPYHLTRSVRFISPFYHLSALVERGVIIRHDDKRLEIADKWKSTAWNLVVMQMIHLDQEVLDYVMPRYINTIRHSYPKFMKELGVTPRDILVI